MTNKIRPIVKAAFKVGELAYQFCDIDVSDGLLPIGTDKEIMKAVNEEYTDAYIVGEARNRLDIAMDECNQEDPSWQRDAKQLRRFISKWG
jgi:hypothetical protein